VNHDATSFLWVGNHPGLDLVNTEAVDARGQHLELVPTWTELVQWSQAAGLIDPELAQRCHAAGTRRGQDVLTWFRRLRDALRHVLEPGLGDPEAALVLDAAVANVAVRLSYRPDQQPGTLPLDARVPLEQLRLALADAALAAARLDRSRVSRCGSPRCVLLFYDTTRNRSRRWCDMAVCGNRAKVSAFYRRARKPNRSAGSMVTNPPYLARS
jgi:predicted RNA-binding Zn ribbon-like protein